MKFTCTKNAGVSANEHHTDGPEILTRVSEMEDWDWLDRENFFIDCIMPVVDGISSPVVQGYTHALILSQRIVF